MLIGQGVYDRRDCYSQCRHFSDSGVVQYGQDTLIAQAALKIALHLRQRVYAHLHKLDLIYFGNSPNRRSGLSPDRGRRPDW